MTSFSTENGIFYNCDCISGAQQFIPDGSVDLILTDPPYGISGDMLHHHYNRDERFVVGGYIEVPAEKYADFSVQWIREAERVLKPGGSLYIVSGYTNLIDILNALKRTNLKEINHIIWKYNFGVFTSRKYVSSHYHILFYEKPGDKRTYNIESRFGKNEKEDSGGSLNYQDREDVWVINREYKPGKIKNKNELPAALLTKIIQYSSNEGDLICDMFLGGFSTARVAIGLNRRAVGFELSSSVFEAKMEEMRKVTPGSLLPTIRSPIINPIRNQGKGWTDEEIIQLQKRYGELIKEKRSIKEISMVLQEEFGRGYWSINKMLKTRGMKKKGKTGRSKDV